MAGSSSSGHLQMSEAIEQPREDAVVEQSTAAPALDTWGELDQALADFDSKVSQQQPEPTPDESSISGTNTPDQTLDRQVWEDLLGPDPRIGELQSQVDAFKASEFQAQEREAASKWAAELQDVCARSNPNIEDNFVIREIKVLSADHPGVLEAAWQYRGLTDAQLAIAQKDYAAAEKLYQRVLAEPDSEQKQNALRYLEQQGARLRAMLSARSVIRSVRNEIRKRGDAVKAGYDPIASADRELAAQSVRDARGELNPRPEQIEWGKLSGAEGRRKVKEEFGFDPGWGH